MAEHNFKENFGLLKNQEAEAACFDTDAWFATPELRDQTKGVLLEITISWQGALLDIAHYRYPRRITFGPNPNADFCYTLSADNDPTPQIHHIPLIQPSKTGNFLLCFDPYMNGYLEENGEQLTFLDLVKADRAHWFERSGLYHYPLLPGTTVHICGHSVQIQIRFVPSPPAPFQWFHYLDTQAPVLSFSIIIHLLLTCLAIISITPSAPPPVQKKPAIIKSQQVSHQQTSIITHQKTPTHRDN
jgi:hypothetical protein